MIASDLVRVGLALGMLAVHSKATVWLGIACLAGISTFSAFFQPASGAALPNLVSLEELAPAQALMGASWGSMAIGAALGGVVASVFGRPTAFIVNAASFLLSGILIALVKGRFAEDRDHTRELRPIRDLVEGFSYARSDRRIVALLATKGGFGLGVGVVSLLSIFATKVFKAGDIGIGVLFAARGLGALLGPFMARAIVKTDFRRLILAIGVSMGVYGVAYLVFPAMPVIALAAALAAIAHLGGGAQWLLSSYGLQVITPDGLRGRILALDLGLVSLTMSISAFTAGWLADRFGPRPVMAGLALVEIAYALVWTFFTRSLWRKPISPPTELAGETA
ncbi:MAG: MFS transporter [Actinomycetota bacterium]